MGGPGISTLPRTDRQSNMHEPSPGVTADPTRQGLFAGKIGLVMGVANDHSIAWAMTEALYAEGAELAFTHLPSPSGERRVRGLVGPRGPKVVVPCDVQRDEDIARVFDAVRETYGRLDFLVHSVAFAPPQELRNPYLDMSRAGWHLAMDISVFSLVASCRAATPLMTGGGAVVTLSYYGGEKVVPGYNVMGVCKATLEHSVRYLAWDLGRRNIRVNAISAGPMRTLSTAGISRFDELRDHAAQKSPLGRNVEPRELGTTCLYLLSDLSAGVTGEVVHVDCGYSIVGL
jgi:enoyl-[acyl-carrier protein] reductase I